MVHYHGFDFDAHVRAFDAIYRVIDEEVPADRIIDLTHLSGKTTYLVDHIHLSEEGCRRVAEVVAEKLRKQLEP
jgi:lysophospholipase L1-like esterase